MIKEKSNSKEDKINIKLSMDPHSRDSILFLKHIGENYKYSHALFECGKEYLSKMVEYLKTIYDLDVIFQKSSSSYENYKPNDDMDFIDKLYSDTVINDNTILLDMNKKVVVDIGYESIKILSLHPIEDEMKTKLQELQFEHFNNNNSNSVHILSHSSERGMYFSDFKIDDKYKDLDIESNYNEDFKEVYDSIVKNLSKNQIGLYLLHGQPGTGKTTLLRHLIRVIDKRLIFISPSMASQFSNPDMIPFLMKYPDSIIIIEDSENIIKKRENGADQSVSNLLNLSDGILGDCLKFQIICTFNTSKDQIDEALSRKGRLIKSYEFDKLSVEKSNKLLEKNNMDFRTETPMVLSDIYTRDQNNFEKEKSSIGFK